MQFEVRSDPDEHQNTKRSRFSEEQIIAILKEHGAGVSVADLCRRQGVSDASIYKREAKSRLPSATRTGAETGRPIATDLPEARP
jgi:transposase-like protein